MKITTFILIWSRCGLGTYDFILKEAVNCGYRVGHVYIYMYTLY